LKIESEERETWTAESLRAASSAEKQFSKVEAAIGRDFGGTRFLTRCIADRLNFGRKPEVQAISEWTSSSYDKRSQSFVRASKRDLPG
jgi:hypothetical protein